MTNTEAELVAAMRALLKSFGRRNAAANTKAKDAACALIWRLEAEAKITLRDYAPDDLRIPRLAGATPSLTFPAYEPRN